MTGAWYRELLLGVLAELRSRTVDTVAVVDVEGGYVQLLDRKARPTVYLEAFDPGFRGGPPLGPARRKRLAMLGWSDPKLDPMPYRSAGYAHEWRGGNLAQEWPRGGDPVELARLLADTLLVYRAPDESSVRVEVFDAITPDGG